MKLVSLSPFQQSEFKMLHPHGAVAGFAAIIPYAEYEMWAASFASLRNKAEEFFDLDLTVYESLPILHWTAKLTLPVADGKINDSGLLVPKAFKVGVLPEGTYKDFGYQLTLLSLLKSLVTTFSGIKPSDFIYPDLTGFLSESILGIQAWDAEDCSDSIGDRYLPLVFDDCVRDVEDISLIGASMFYDKKRYSYAVTTSNLFDNEAYQNQISAINQQHKLLPPLGFPLANIERFEDFTHPNWASVFAYPNKKLQQQAEKSGQYVLIKRDTHKIYSWPAVQADPMLRLELDMEDEWMWQQACPSPLPDITLCWSPALNYPWMRTQKTDAWIPALVLAEGIE